MGRNIKSTIPTVPEQLTPEIPDRNIFKKKEEASRINQKRNFDNRHKVHEMKPLSSGTTVFITDMKCRGKVIQRAGTPRSCVADTPTSFEEIVHIEESFQTFQLIKKKNN